MHSDAHRELSENTSILCVIFYGWIEEIYGIYRSSLPKFIGIIWLVSLGGLHLVVGVFSGPGAVNQSATG